MHAYNELLMVRSWNRQTRTFRRFAVAYLLETNDKRLFQQSSMIARQNPQYPAKGAGNLIYFLTV
jgi:hypothetical protein